MSMHLMKIRVTEKSTSKKWASAEAKQKAQELEKSWEELKEKHVSRNSSSLAQKRKESKGCSHLINLIPPRGTNAKITSKGDTVGIAPKPDQKVYTGDKVIGISIVHKSCLQPVFSAEQAKDFAEMRR